jgi:HSP20 family protein
MSGPRHPNPNALFWDFINSLDPNQAPGPGPRGASHGPGPNPNFFGNGFPFRHRGPPGPWDQWEQWFQPPGADESGPRHRHRGRREEAEPQNTANENQAHDAPATAEQGSFEKEGSPDTVDVPDPAEVTPDESDYELPEYEPFAGRGRGRGRGCRHRGGGPGPRGRGGCRRGHRSSPHHGHDRNPHHGPSGPHPFDFSGFMRSLAEQLGGPVAAAPDARTSNDHESFTPPVDIFDTDRAFVLHVALPGAKKEDVGVSWDPEAGALRIAGVVHRPGDEAFLRALATAERRVGVFERSIPLPPTGTSSRDEVDAQGITARMEDGVLVVTVPKVEKEWTEVHRVEIQ